jgi:hypothetical protein
MRWPTPRDGFDPKKQSWGAGAIAALETFVGGGLALAAGLGTLMTVSMLFEGRTAHGRLSPLQGLFLSLGLGAVGIGFLWAGLSLMFGWRTTWRSQALPVATLLLSLVYLALAAIR